MDNRTLPEDEARQVASIVGLSALKYGDLSNQASKDYVFDIDRFSSFEGNTGPYILYTIVRIKSILARYAQEFGSCENCNEMNRTQSATEKQLMTELVRFNSVFESAYCELAPHKICAYIYNLSDAFNKFYHENNIMGESDAVRQSGFIALLKLTRHTLETCIDLLGFSAPERM